MALQAAGSAVRLCARWAGGAVMLLWARGAAPPKGEAPAGRISWLVTPPERAGVRWLFSPRQTVLLAVLVLAISIITLLMIFPVLPTLSPAGLIYAFHDEIVLPVRGRIFQRYFPVPQIVVAVMIALAIGFLLARGLGQVAYEKAVRVWLRFPPARAALAQWLALRPGDAHLWSALEAEYRRMSDNWLADRAKEDGEAVRKMGRYLLDLPWRAADLAHDIALAGLAARHSILSALIDPVTPATFGPALERSKGPFCRSFIAALEGGDEADEALDAAWGLAGRKHPQLRDTARDAVIWCAWAMSLKHGDASIARRYQSRLAEVAFERDFVQSNRGGDQTLFDPGLWLLGPVRDAGSAEPGAGMTGEAAAELLAGLTAKRAP